MVGGILCDFLLLVRLWFCCCWLVVRWLGRIVLLCVGCLGQSVGVVGVDLCLLVVFACLFAVVVSVYVGVLGV